MHYRSLFIGVAAASLAAGSAQAMDVWHPAPSNQSVTAVRHARPAYTPSRSYDSAPSYDAGPIYDAPPAFNSAPAYDPAAFNFDGFYLGAQGGGVVGGLQAGSLGVVAGSNFTLADPLLAGIEFQADALLKGGGNTYDFYALGRLGVVVSSNFMAYAEAGPGWTAGTGGYAFGAGGEYALTDVLSVKGDVQGVGAWGAGPTGTKLQAGLLFHLP